MTSTTAGLDAFLGILQFESADEHLEDFLRAVGQNLVMRKLSLKCKPRATLTSRIVDGKEVIHIKMETFFRTVVNEFRLGETFAENMLDLREVDAVWTMEEGGECLKNAHVDRKTGVRSAYERRMTGPDEQTVIAKCGDVTVASIWRKLK